MKLIFVFFALLLMNNYVSAYKLLIVSLMPAKSHHHLNIGLAKTLSKAGHGVTLISPYEIINSTYRAIAISEAGEYVEKAEPFSFSLSKISEFELESEVIKTQKLVSEFTFEHKDVKKMLENDTETFDAVIYESFSGDFLTGFGVKYNCPVIIVCPVDMVDSLNKVMGNPSSVATAPRVLTDLPAKMNLIQRMKNLISHVAMDIFDVLIKNPFQKELYLKYFPLESKMESIDEAKKRIALAFVNSHPSMGVARPLLPNIIEIGGYHISDNPKPLEKDLKDIMDSAENGVIYFSLGSIVKGKHMNANMKSVFLKCFSKLNRTVLWKYEEDMPEKPDNVFIRSWIPQTSILSHPNLKLFITHGGLLSTIESVHFGVPLVVIPVHSDQPHNAKMIEGNGQGVILELENITEASLDWAINEILDNERYAERARQIQDTYFDRALNPLEAISFYTEHVIRTKGAKHLAPPRLCRCSLLLLDVYALILAIVGVAVYSVCFCCRKICRKNSKPETVKKVTKNKKTN